MNVCAACGLDFTGVSDFDSHRLGKFPQTGPAEYDERVRAGLTDEDWRPELGRRCLTEFELHAKRWSQDRFGRWQHPRRKVAASRQGSLRKAA